MLDGKTWASLPWQKKNQKKQNPRKGDSEQTVRPAPNFCARREGPAGLTGFGTIIIMFWEELGMFSGQAKDSESDRPEEQTWGLQAGVGLSGRKRTSSPSRLCICASIFEQEGW